MSQLWPVLLGAVLAIGGGYLGARWQGQQQRMNLLHEARLALYVDLIAYCLWRRSSLHGEGGRNGPGLHPPVPLDARVELHANGSIKLAWVELKRAWEDLAYAAERDGMPSASEVEVSDKVAWSRAKSQVEKLESAVRAEVFGAPPKPGRWSRFRSWVSGLRTRA